MRRRNHRVQAWLNDKEFDDFLRKVEQSGRSKEAFVRAALANKRVVELPPVDYGRLIFETRRIGQNLNQLLKMARLNRYVNTADLHDCVQEIRAVENKIHDAFFAQKLEE